MPFFAMKSKFVSCLLLISFSLISLQVYGADQTTTDNARQAKNIDLAVKASENPARQEALKLLIFSTVLSAKTGNLIEVSPKTRETYNRIRLGVFAPIVMTPFAISVGFSARQSAKTFESVLAPITAVLRAVAELVAQSGEALWNILEALKIDKSLDWSGDVVKASYEALKPIIEVFISKGALISSGTVSGSAMLGASSFLVLNDAEVALTHKQVAQLLGYDSNLKNKVDLAVTEVGSAFNFDLTNRSLLRDELVNEIYKQAAEKGFDHNAEYTIDVIGLMKKNNLISQEQYMTTLLYQDLYKATALGTLETRPGLERLRDSVDHIAAVCAVLHELIENGKLNKKDRMEALYMHDNALKVLGFIKNNLELAK